MMTRTSSRIALAAVMATLVMSCDGETPDDNKVEVIEADFIDVSLPLSDLVKIPLVEEEVGVRAREAQPIRRIPNMQGGNRSHQADPVVQSFTGTAQIPSPLANFEGMGTGMAGFSVSVAPPDTIGDIGPNHYVQAVNSSITIFSRTG